MHELPSGTLTFLFTDIEGSTRLWEQAPDAMQVALERHDTLLRQHIEANQGYVFKTVGDAFCAAFAYAPDALSAALAVQRALNSEVWPAEIGAIRIRAALHTGAVEERDGDYFGPPLNRVARLLAAGHGEQTLLSGAAQELLRDYLPVNASLLDLGEHRLKDLFLPERVFQVSVPDLPSSFSPLKTLDAKLTNLPAQPTTFIGRERELAAVLGLLRRDDVRLLTLTGPGGTGKTRLSLQVAADLLDEYENGVFFVPLATITDPELVIPTIAEIFGIKRSEGQRIDALLKQYFAEKHLLLVLDNLEQVVQAAPGIGELLAAAKRLTILASSREKLRLYGEHEYPVPPLSLPDLKKKPTLAVLSQYEAVALFIQRAKAANVAFGITEQNAPAVAEICVRLDGLPLAIELAAARSKLLPPQAMLERLSSRLKALIGGARDLPARQQTIRATIDWSYNLLDGAEKALYARLGVFVGSWTLEAAEAICGDGLATEVFAGLESLTDKSLLRQIEGANGELRFMMLETLREYACERLAETNTAESIRERHLSYFFNLAERAEVALTGPDQIAWVNRLEEELGNLRAALACSLEKRPEAGLGLASALHRYWLARGYFIEGAEWLSRFLAHSALSSPSSARAKALNVQAHLCFILDHVHKPELAEQALALSREIGDRRGEAFSLYILGYWHLWRGKTDQSRLLETESLDLYKKLGDKVGVAELLILVGLTNKDHPQLAKGQFEESIALSRKSGDLAVLRTGLLRIAGLALHQGEFARAEAYAQEALEIGRLLGSRGITLELGQMGDVAFWQGHYEQAQAFYEEAIALAKENGQKATRKWCAARLGYIAIRQGNQEQAQAILEAGCREFNEREPIEVVFSIEGLASLATMQGQWARAVRLFAWADAVRETIGDVRSQMEQMDVNQDIDRIRRQIDDTSFMRAETEGRAMTTEQAIAYALGNIIE